MNSPSWVPRTVTRTATRSSALNRSSIVNLKSGNPGPQHGVLLLQALAGRWNSPELFVVHEPIGQQVVQPIEAPRVERLLVIPADQGLTSVISHVTPPPRYRASRHRSRCLHYPWDGLGVIRITCAV